MGRETRAVVMAAGLLMFVCGSALADTVYVTDETSCLPADGPLCLHHTNAYPPGNPWSSLAVEVHDGTTVTEVAELSCYPPGRASNSGAELEVAGTPVLYTAGLQPFVNYHWGGPVGVPAVWADGTAGVCSSFPTLMAALP